MTTVTYNGKRYRPVGVFLQQRMPDRKVKIVQGCPYCQGAGVDRGEYKCWQCKGTGMLETVRDLMLWDGPDFDLSLPE